MGRANRDPILVGLGFHLQEQGGLHGPRSIELAGQGVEIDTIGGNDLIFAAGIDRNHGNAGMTWTANDARQIDARLAKRRQRYIGEIVLADRTDHGNLGAGPRCGERLIGAFAAGVGVVVGGGDGLARARQARDRGDQVQIDRAENGDHSRARRSVRSAKKPSASIEWIQVALGGLAVTPQ